jgi:hypothetical protein
MNEKKIMICYVVAGTIALVGLVAMCICAYYGVLGNQVRV